MNNFRVVAVWLLLCVIWSSTWIFIKNGLDDLPPMLFAGLRFVIASAVLIAINLARRAPWPRSGRAWAFIVVTGWMTFSINYGCLFWGEKQVASGLAAVLQAGIPVFGLIFAHFHLPSERLTLAKVGGVLLGLFGVTLICYSELHLAGPLALWGSVSIVIGGISTSYASVLVKAHARDLDPGVLAAWQMFFGWLPLVAAGWWYEGSPWQFHWTGQAVFALFYLALLGSALAFCLLYWLVRRVEITKVMLISLVTPVAAVMIGAAARHEHLAGSSLAGGACVLLGLCMVIYRREPQATLGKTPEEGLLESAER